MLPPDPRWCARISAHRHAPEPAAAPVPDGGMDESCDVCGSARTEWRKCKLVCLQCRQIVKSCADL
jgi:hypothetical protein